jgi:peptidoglycan/LPS O-acetylase OafA/YrhL
LRDAKVRLHSLDALRGLAALAVVLWHWQHFQLLGTQKSTWSWSVGAGPLDHSHQPFFSVLRLFYDHGHMAVDLFFLISGFIFFWLYANEVADRSLSILKFWVLRITRLYPLHFVTLAIVAGLQLLFFAQTGDYFVYSVNDLRHFILSLLFFQTNGGGAAFNGPTWSITVELVMYGLFCVAAQAGLLRYAIAPFLIFLLGLFLYSGHQNIATGICGFFGGGLIYHAFSRAQLSDHRRKICITVSAATMVGWLVVFISSYVQIMPPLSDPARALMLTNETLLSLCVSYVLFPLTILALAMHENTTRFRYRYLSWLGNISYSSYLLHFPLQIVFALAIVGGFVPLRARDTDAFFLIYVAILIAISLLSFRSFEAPIQQILRQAWRNMVQLPRLRRREHVEPVH